MGKVFPNFDGARTTPENQLNGFEKNRDEGFFYMKISAAIPQLRPSCEPRQCGVPVPSGGERRHGFSSFTLLTISKILSTGRQG
jgi:hypothetical protein